MTDGASDQDPITIRPFHAGTPSRSPTGPHVGTHPKSHNSAASSTHASSHSGNVTRIISSTAARTQRPTCFDRHELNVILNVYGRRVAPGEWRDYARDMEKDRAVFSIFRRSSEMPIYRIEKNPKFARKQGAWSIVSASGQILKRGHELQAVLRIFESKPRLYQV